MDTLSPALTLSLSAGVGLSAGAVASVAGFGIGSLLTPLLAASMGTKLAVAIVSIPHAVGTAVRFWMMRRHVDRRLLLGFGLMSAVGGLCGALLNTLAAGTVLTLVLGSLLVFAGLTGLTGVAEHMRFKGWLGWVAGGLSGFLGGLVGNQGGIRSAAMLGFEVEKRAFVATATAIALMVDGARVPVYLVKEGSEIAGQWPLLVSGSLGVVAGTLVGARVLERVPEGLFRKLVSAVVLVLGAAMLLAAWR
jgi:uncharacterized protein